VEGEIEASLISETERGFESRNHGGVGVQDEIGDRGRFLYSAESRKKGERQPTEDQFESSAWLFVNLLFRVTRFPNFYLILTIMDPYTSRLRHARTWIPAGQRVNDP
jgi:hypothetical protein